jgi:hypothetical protein
MSEMKTTNNKQNREQSFAIQHHVIHQSGKSRWQLTNAGLNEE